jgi:integrase/recombinase XerD
MRSFQPATVSITRRVLSHFARTIEPRDLLEATRYDVEAFLSRDIAPGTRRVYRSRIRGFYLWCIEEELVQVSPAGRIPPIKVAKGLPRPISTEQLSAALEGAGPRMRAWLVLDGPGRAPLP